MLLLPGVRARFDGVLPHRLVAVDRVVLLGEVTDLQAVAGNQTALSVGAFHPGEQLEQGRFAGTVSAEDNNPRTLVDS